MPDAPITQAETPNQNGAAAKPTINVIPDKFYGAALKTPVRKPDTLGGVPQPVKTKSGGKGLIIAIVFLLVLAGLGAGAYFVYTNKDVLFGAPPAVETPPVQVATSTQEPEPPPPVLPPAAPLNLMATSGSPYNVSLSWTDNSDNESAFRIERRGSETSIYSRLTDLPPNSTNFQDGSVVASTTYLYRVIARNEGGESEPSAEAQAVVMPLPPVEPKQTPLPPAGLDTDSDGITDLEEVLFGANTRNPDSDGDGFLDGNEVFNLYNPMGRAPAKLLESAMIKEYKTSKNWSFSAPKDWKVAVALDDMSATIETGNGENFVIKLEANEQKMELLDWLKAKYPDIENKDLMQYKTKRGYEGLLGPDQLTTYLPWDGFVVVVSYDMAKQPFINYRTVYSMVMNSLMLVGKPDNMIPAGTGQLPFEPAATGEGEMTKPQPLEPEPETAKPESSIEVFPNPAATTDTATTTP